MSSLRVVVGAVVIGAALTLESALVGDWADEKHLTRGHAISADGTMWANVVGGDLRLAGVDSGKRTSFPAKELRATKLVFSFDGKALATDRHDGTIVIVEVATGRTRLTLSGHEGTEVKGLAFSRNGRFLASAAPVSTNPVILWDLGTGDAITQFASYGAGLAFSPDSRFLAHSRSEGVSLWDIKSRTVKAELPIKGVTSLAFDDAGRVLAAAGNKLVTLFDVERLKVIDRFQTPNDVQGLVFFPGGSDIVIGSGSKAFLWRYASNQFKTIEVADRNHGLRCIGVSSDGKLLTTDGLLAKWDVAMVPWRHADEARLEGQKKQQEAIAQNEKDLEEIPERIRKARTLGAADDIPTSLSDAHEKFKKDSLWRDKVINELKESLTSDSDDIRDKAARCISTIPEKVVTDLMLDACMKGKTYSAKFLDALNQRINRPHPAPLSIEQQRAIVPYLLECLSNPKFKQEEPHVMLMKIRDPRIAPAIFAILEKHKDLVELDIPDVSKARQACRVLPYSLNNAELGYPTTEDMWRTDPRRASELWLAWYKLNGSKLIWSDKTLMYTFKR